MRILVVSTVLKFVESFLVEFLKKVDDRGYFVDIATNLDDILYEDKLKRYQLHDVRFNRSLRINTLKNSYFSIQKVLSLNDYNIIHTHTPISSAIVRVANVKKTPLIYSAHGFHFHSKSSLLSWLLYFPIELFLSFKTDILVTTNMEDFKLSKMLFHPKRLELIYGVGVDFGRFIYQEKSKLYLHKLGIPESSKVLVSVGELNKNKNHSLVIHLLSERPELHKVHFVICGEGNYRDDLTQLINKLDLSNRVHLLGHRKDIPLILAAADLFVFPSKREGFGMALLEAILSDLDFVAFRIRGIVDLVPEKIHSSHLVEAYNKRLMGDMIVDKIAHPQPFNHKEHLQWLKQFSVEEVNQKYLNLYESLLTGKDSSHS